MKKKLGVMLLALSIVSVLFAQDNNFSYIDVITLKDGSIIKGIIIENKLNESIKVEVGLNTFFYKHNQIESLTKEKITKQLSQQQFQNSGKNNGNSREISPSILAEIDRLENEKGSPGLAFFLSFLLVGGGQFYNGDTAAGVVHLLVAGAGGSMWIGGAVGAVKNRADYTVNRRYSMVSAIGSGVVLINFLWSMIDAPFTAFYQNFKIDEKIKYLKVSKKSPMEESVKFAISPSFGEKSIDGVFLGLSYGF